MINNEEKLTPGEKVVLIKAARKEMVKSMADITENTISRIALCFRTGYDGFNAKRLKTQYQTYKKKAENIALKLMT